VQAYSVNIEFAKMWNEVVVSYTDIAQNLTGGTEEVHENLSQDAGCPGRLSNPLSPNYKSAYRLS
jgi:hypothetical protein